ncbi:MAG: hypothetical protein ACLSHM_01770 [Vescimonas sp.]
MLASVLSRHFCTLKTRANLNNHIGTPRRCWSWSPDTRQRLSGRGPGPLRPDPLYGQPGAARHRRDHQHRRRPSRTWAVRGRAFSRPSARCSTICGPVGWPFCAATTPCSTA